MRAELLRRLKEFEDALRYLDDQEEEIERRDTDAQFAQHLVCPHPSMANFLRYETTNQRQLYRALAELDRLQSFVRIVWFQRGASVHRAALH